MTTAPSATDAAGYLAPGPFTDPGDLSGRLDRLLARALDGPDGRDPPRALAAAVRSVLVHPFWREAYGLPPEAARAAEETNIRDLRTTLERIGAQEAALGRSGDDPAPLPPSHRLNGNCRHHAALFTALLRRAGVPARARCGFGAYFEPGKWIDHWLVERWDGRRWAVSDPQLDDVQRQALRLGFDPLDLPDGAFASGGEAWLACRGGDDPERYGILRLHGWDFVKGNLVRDVCALAGEELLPWDVWGIAAEPTARLAPSALDALDVVARATPMRAPLSRADATALAATPDFRVGARIRSWFTGAPVEVDLSPILGPARAPLA
jgi:hypothetical protein